MSKTKLSPESKLLLDKRITNCFEDLKRISKDICRKDKRTVSHRIDFEDLFQSCFLELVELNPKGLLKSLSSDLDFTKYFSKCMSNKFYWKRYEDAQNPLKHNKFFPLHLESDPEDSNHHDPSDNSHQDIYLQAEPTTQSTKDHIRDLLNQNLSKDSIEKLFRLPEIISKLCPSDKIIYQKAFLDGMSGRAISREFSKTIKIPHQDICCRINFIRNFIQKQINIIA